MINGEKIDVEDRKPKANAYGGSNYGGTRGAAPGPRRPWDGRENREGRDGRDGRDNNRPPSGSVRGSYSGRGRGSVRGRGSAQTSTAA